MLLTRNQTLGNRHHILIFTCWLAVNSFLLWHNGIIVDGEGEKYIRESERFLATGSVSTPNFWLYFTQILLISISTSCSLGLHGVVALQILFNLLAAFVLYRLASGMFLKRTALLTALLFLLNYPMQRFSTYLHTESIFYSFTLIFSVYVLQLKKLGWRDMMVVLAGLAIISVTRPTGLLFLPPAFLYLFFRFFPNISFRAKLAAFGAISLGFLYLLNLAIGSGGELDFMLPYRDEQIICGVPTLPYFVDIQTAENPNSLYGLFYYITHNFSQFINLAYHRSIAFFGLMRSYYSITHNAFLAAAYYPLYGLALWSMQQWIRKFPYHLLYFSAILLLTWVTVLLSCDDWHNRFFMSIAPYIFILALPTINAVFAQKITNES